MDTGIHAIARARLLVLTDSPLSIAGGSERFLRNLMEGLPADRFEITVVQLCEEPSSDCRLHRQPIPSVCRDIFFPFGALYGWQGLYALYQVRRLVRKGGYHVIQSQHEKSDIFNALLPRGPLRAARISNRRDTGFMKSPRLQQLLRLLNRRFDRIIAPSTAILDTVAKTERTPRERMLCIPNGVDTERFRPLDRAALSTGRTALGWSQGEIQIGCTAELSPVKRHVDLVDAFAQVHAQFPQARLNLIGDGELRTSLELRIRALGLSGAVRLMGRRNDVDALLPLLDLFVLASDTEGLSNAILEAQASGLPVIATRVGGNPELVDDDCGILVAARQPAALADAMVRLLHDSTARTRLGARARARVEHRHSLSAMRRAYEALYREVRHGY